MSRSSMTTVAKTLLTIIRVFPRLVPRTLLLVIAVIGVMFAALALAVTIAAPSGEEIAYTLAQGTGTATIQLVLANTWWLIPISVMFAAMLAFTGMLLHFTDAVVSRKRVHDLHALTATIPRLPAAAMVVVVYTLISLIAVVGAPLISLAALAALIMITLANRQRRTMPAWLPTKRTTAMLIIPFLAAATVIVRWSLAFGDVFLTRTGWREALRMSWRRTEGQVRPVGTVLLITFGGTLVVSWGVNLLGVVSESAWLELAVQLTGSLLVAPVPAITLLVLFRSFGGRGSDLVETLVGTPRMSSRRIGPGVSIAVSLALVVTMLTPPPPATASEGGGEAPPAPIVELDDSGDTPAHAGGEEPPVAGSFVTGQSDRDLSLEAFAPESQSFTATALEPTSVIFDNASTLDWSWQFGSQPALTGEVAATGGLTPTGYVQLWGMTLDPAEDPVAIGEAVELVGGRFDVGGALVLPGIRKLWAAYDGDAQHAASSSDEQLVSVGRMLLNGQATVLAPTGAITVGDRVRVRVEVDPAGDSVPGHEPTGELELIDSSNLDVVGSAVLTDGIATFEFIMAGRSLQLSVNAIDDTRYWMSLGGGEWVIQAEPAASTTTLSVQQTVSLGAEALAIAQIGRPAGVSVTGIVEFFYTDGPHGVKTPLGSASVNPQGVASLSFCVGTSTAGSDPGVCAAVPRAIVDPASSTLRVSAEFTSGPAQDSRRPLLPSASSVQVIEVHPAGSVGTGVCKIVQLDSQVLNLPHATPVQRASVGDPAVQTGSNCSTHDVNGDLVLGHRDGTVLVFQARPKAGYELVEWLRDGQRVGTQSTLVWRMPDAPQGWYETFQPVYQPRCLTVDMSTTGHVRAVERVVGFSNPLAVSAGCYGSDGSRGVYQGATMLVEAEGAMNPRTGEVDAFYGAEVNGVAVTDVTRRLDSALVPHHEMRFDVSRASTVRVDYGPTCRTVQTDASFYPPAPRDGNDDSWADYLDAQNPATGLPELLTAPNCSSPMGSGWYRNAEVTVRAQLDGPYTVVGGWRVNGELREELGTDPLVTVTVGDPQVTTIEYDIAHCYPVEATLGDGIWSRDNSSFVAVQPAPNCSDGSDRYAEGTTVTLTPWTGYSHGNRMSFGGWTDSILDADGNKVDERITSHNRDDDWYSSGAERAAGTTVRWGERTVELQAPLVTVAHFYADAACSTFSIGGWLHLADLRLSDTSCGPGRYYDRAKQELPADGLYSGHQFAPDGTQYPEGVKQRYERAEDEQMRKQYYEHDLDRYPFTRLSFEVPGSTLDIYGTVTMTQKSPSRTNWTWKLTEDIECVGVSCTLNVRGDVRVQLAACQGLDVTVNLQVAGDESETVYSPEDLGINDFDWVVSDTSGCGNDLAWVPGRTATLRAQAPIVGMEFLDWGAVDNLVGLEWFVNHQPSDPRSPLAVQVLATDGDIDMKVEVDFVVHCAELKLDGVVGVVEPAPNCPGTPTGMSYMIGSFVMVAAARLNPNGRNFVRFNDDTVIHSTEGVLDIAPEELLGFDADRPWVKNMVTQLEEFRELKSQPPDWMRPTSNLPDQNFHTGITLVQQDGQVIAGYYQYPPDGFERFGAAMANVGKMMVGVTMLGITAAMPFCPPCAAAVTLLTASEYLVRLIPGGDFLGNIIAMANPMNFIECTAKWGLGNLDPEDSSEPDKWEGGKSFVGLIVGAGAAAYKRNVVVNDPEKLERFQKWTKVGKSGAAAATFAYGLYESKLWEMEFADGSASSLRDTAAYEQCLSDTWKSPTSS